jgi:hypothetical protein
MPYNFFLIPRVPQGCNKRKFCVCIGTLQAGVGVVKQIILHVYVYGFVNQLPV